MNQGSQGPRGAVFVRPSSRRPSADAQAIGGLHDDWAQAFGDWRVARGVGAARRSYSRGTGGQLPVADFADFRPALRVLP